MGMMSATPDLLADFLELEKRLEAEPEHVTGEIARGIYMMSPRPRPRHGNVQGNLFRELSQRFGAAGGGENAASPEWLFVVEAEARYERTFSRLVPDLAAWRRSTSGWPDLDITPVALMPDWVAEVLSPSTARFDREEKLGAYGSMGVGWVWLVDADAQRVETFINVRGQMVASRVVTRGDSFTGDPFGAAPIPVSRFFV
jgi:Uma2 family endonuclease